LDIIVVVGVKMKTIPIRFNDSELEQLKRIKRVLNTEGTFGEDSRTIKACLSLAENVLHNQFGGNLAGLFVNKSTKKNTLKDDNSQEF